jgi:hypothetical protein
VAHGFIVTRCISDSAAGKLSKKSNEVAKIPAKARGKMRSLLHRKHTTDFASAEETNENEDQELKLTVTDALTELQNCINRFQKEVDMCRDERLGRIEKSQYLVSVPLCREIPFADGVLTLAGVEEVSKFVKGNVAMNYNHWKMFEVHVNDTLYRLFTSSPYFNSRNGERKSPSWSAAMPSVLTTINS